MTQIAEPQNARSRRTAESILANARELIEEQGFESVTMAAVGERAGVSRRAVYLHFASRTDLLVAVFNHIGDRYDLRGSEQPVWDAPDAETALAEFASHMSRFHINALPVSRAIERASHTDELAARLWRTIMRNWRTTARRLMRRLDDEGVLAPFWSVATATDMLCALMSFELTESLVVDRGWSRPKYAEHLAELFRSTFVRR
jgi:AcrR family transcriptional regulator